MSNVFYAVQVGDNEDCDFGSYNWNDAIALCKDIAKEQDEENTIDEIRICTIITGKYDNVCDDVTIYRYADRNRGFDGYNTMKLNDDCFPDGALDIPMF